MKKEETHTKKGLKDGLGNPLAIEGLIFLIGMIGLIAYFVYKKYF
jgi:hypothetical protein